MFLILAEASRTKNDLHLILYIFKANSRRVWSSTKLREAIQPYP
jgi:hypothetical protein